MSGFIDAERAGSQSELGCCAGVVGQESSRASDLWVTAVDQLVPETARTMRQGCPDGLRPEIEQSYGLAAGLSSSGHPQDTVCYDLGEVARPWRTTEGGMCATQFDETSVGSPDAGVLGTGLA